MNGLVGQELLRADLDRVFTRLEDDWPRLRGARLFVTGGTGFIGRWMLEALREADTRLGLQMEVVVLTRDPDGVARRAPHLAQYPGFRFIAGDVCDLAGTGDRFSHVLHAATDASAELNERDPRRMFDTIVTGTRRALDFALDAGAQRVVFLSSGAVYGPQPWEVEKVAEHFRGGPNCQDPKIAYAEGKRAAEMLCAIYGKQFGLDIVSARIFAVLGPLLSLDIHFAAGNFIRDALAGEKVRVIGGGGGVRSYLYATDLTVWLWAMLLRAERGAVYNVGSEESVSIAALAERVSGLLGNAGFEILDKADPGWNLGRYVPSTELIRTSLNLQAEVGLDEAIRRTAAWNGWVQ